MRRVAAFALLGMLVGCSSVTEPKPKLTPDEIVMAQVDSIIAANKTDAMFVTAAGAGGANSPECREALRDYAIAVTAYAIAVAAVRVAPNALNVAAAALAAIIVIQETSKVNAKCNTATRPA